MYWMIDTYARNSRISPSHARRARRMDNAHHHPMTIVESWQAARGQVFAIMALPLEDCGVGAGEQFEPRWIDDAGELWPFGGTVGYSSPCFATLDVARAFLLQGIEAQDTNPDIWLEMVAVAPTELQPRP